MVVAPHAGIDYSGARRGARRCARSTDRAGCAASSSSAPITACRCEAWRFTRPRPGRRRSESRRSPGNAAQAILSLDGVEVDARPFTGEHSLEMPLIFVQRLLPWVEIVPVLVGDAEPALVEEAVGACGAGRKRRSAFRPTCRTSFPPRRRAGATMRPGPRSSAARGANSSPATPAATPRCAARSASPRRAACARPASPSPPPTKRGAQASASSATGPSPSRKRTRRGSPKSDRARLIAVAAASLEFAAAHDGEAPEIALGADVSPALSAQRASFVTLERDGDVYAAASARRRRA